MSSTDVGSRASAETQELSTIDMALEVVQIPGSDIDRAKTFVVRDIDAARDDLISRGVSVSEVEEQRPPGLDAPAGERSSFARASLRDPDGNSWVLQEVTNRLPGRAWED